MRHDSHFVESLSERFGGSLGRWISIDEIETNPEQPRSSVGDLAELTASIESKGILEPLLVRPLSNHRYRIIAGERRFRAALEAGLTEVPCIELDVPDNEVLEIALIENLHRRDLHPFEEAEGYSALAGRHGYT
ncbi:MAG TPA: ParB/RepB/Spo0J family partition protein, partial [Thermoanaerobaculia bacterium]